jgi:very-long-chain (3R)-3-hydroxyacyl-CoA dehydratase
MAQWGGWVMIMYERLTFLAKPSMTPFGMTLVYSFQVLAIMEILHALTSVVRASPLTTFIQVFGRLQVLFVHYHIREAQTSFGNYPMILAWSFVEIVRYLYLALNVIRIAPFPIVWLRYSLFYILYPIGVYGEMKVLYDSIGEIERTKFLSLNLPNSWNMPFSFATYIRLFLCLLYIPGLYIQYTYMIKQRRVVFSRLEEKKTS